MTLYELSLTATVDPSDSHVDQYNLTLGLVALLRPISPSTDASSISLNISSASGANSASGASSASSNLRVQATVTLSDEDDARRLLQRLHRLTSSELSAAIGARVEAVDAAGAISAVAALIALPSMPPPAMPPSPSLPSAPPVPLPEMLDGTVAHLSVPDEAQSDRHHSNASMVAAVILSFAIAGAAALMVWALLRRQCEWSQLRRRMRARTMPQLARKPGVMLELSHVPLASAPLSTAHIATMAVPSACSDASQPTSPAAGSMRLACALGGFARLPSLNLFSTAYHAHESYQPGPSRPAGGGESGGVSSGVSAKPGRPSTQGWERQTDWAEATVAPAAVASGLRATESTTADHTPASGSTQADAQAGAQVGGARGSAHDGAPHVDLNSNSNPHPRFHGGGRPGGDAGGGHGGGGPGEDPPCKAVAETAAETAAETLAEAAAEATAAETAAAETAMASWRAGGRMRRALIPWEELEMRSPAIGSGAFGEVWMCTHAASEYAVKVLQQDDMASAEATSKMLVESLIDEYEIMRELRHPNVLLTIGIATDYGRHVGIVTELCEASLLDVLHDPALGLHLSWAGCHLALASDVAKGMAYLHYVDTLHRDLKPANVKATAPPTLCLLHGRHPCPSLPASPRLASPRLASSPHHRATIRAAPRTCRSSYPHNGSPKWPTLEALWTRAPVPPRSHSQARRTTVRACRADPPALALCTPPWPLPRPPPWPPRLRSSRPRRPTKPAVALTCLLTQIVLTYLLTFWAPPCGQWHPR